MAKKEWRGVNDLYFHSPQKTEQKKKPVTLDDEPYSQPKKDEPEVRLSQPQLVASSDGFNFNKKCSLKVNVEYLKETSRKRVLFELFAECNGSKELIQSGIEGFEQNGSAETQAMLYYPEKYSKNDTAEYFFEASHTKGEKKVISDRICLPPAWIELELLDEDGEPRAEEKYRVTDPDGNVSEGTLDKNGYARVEGFKPGQCEINFPDLDESIWGYIGSSQETEESYEI